MTSDVPVRTITPHKITETPSGYSATNELALKESLQWEYEHLPHTHRIYHQYGSVCFRMYQYNQITRLPTNTLATTNFRGITWYLLVYGTLGGRGLFIIYLWPLFRFSLELVKLSSNYHRHALLGHSVIGIAGTILIHSLTITGKRGVSWIENCCFCCDLPPWSRRVVCVCAGVQVYLCDLWSACVCTHKPVLKNPHQIRVQI